MENQILDPAIVARWAAIKSASRMRRLIAGTAWRVCLAGLLAVAFFKPRLEIAVAVFCALIVSVLAQAAATRSLRCPNCHRVPLRNPRIEDAESAECCPHCQHILVSG